MVNIGYVKIYYKNNNEIAPNKIHALCYSDKTKNTFWLDNLYITWQEARVPSLEVQLCFCFPCFSIRFCQSCILCVLFLLLLVDLGAYINNKKTRNKKNGSHHTHCDNNSWMVVIERFSVIASNYKIISGLVVIKAVGGAAVLHLWSNTMVVVTLPITTPGALCKSTFLITSGITKCHCYVVCILSPDTVKAHVLPTVLLRSYLTTTTISIMTLNNKGNNNDDGLY